MSSTGRVEYRPSTSAGQSARAHSATARPQSASSSRPSSARPASAGLSQSFNTQQKPPWRPGSARSGHGLERPGSARSGPGLDAWTASGKGAWQPGGSFPTGNQGMFPWRTKEKQSFGYVDKLRAGKTAINSEG